MPLRVTAGNMQFLANLETELAPKTCQVFQGMLPLEAKFIHVRWSGEALWIPFGDMPVELGYENHTTYPAPGQFIFYPGGISEVEILLAYGATSFASKVGALAGNHFATIVEGQKQLPELGRLTLWQGAQNVRFELVS